MRFLAAEKIHPKPNKTTKKLRLSSQYTVTPGGHLQGELVIPGDKSISHRAVMLGSIATGQTWIHNILESQDVIATISAFTQMGVSIRQQNANSLLIEGVGMHGLQPVAQLDLGNSGTALRLIMGLLTAQDWSVSLRGDRSLCTRPMMRVIKPLTMMGAKLGSDNGRPPLQIEPQDKLTAIDYTLPIASAQVKSAVLFAGLFATGKTRIFEPSPTRDHSERMLQTFAYPISVENGCIMIEGGGKLRGCQINVPADLSSATFFIVAALLMPQSEVTLLNVGINPTRHGVISILRKMGASIELLNQRKYGAEPVADIHVCTSDLSGSEIGGDEVTLAIDEIPIIAIAAAYAQGTTVISGAQELRVKESDRIKSIVKGLRALSVDAVEMPDGMRINGGVVNGGVVDSCADHRIAMSFSIAGAVARSQVQVLNCDNVATSFPNFLQFAQKAGIQISD